MDKGTRESFQNDEGNAVSNICERREDTDVSIGKEDGNVSYIFGGIRDQI